MREEEICTSVYLSNILLPALSRQLGCHYGLFWVRKNRAIIVWHLVLSALTWMVGGFRIFSYVLQAFLYHLFIIYNLLQTFLRLWFGWGWHLKEHPNVWCWDSFRYSGTSFCKVLSFLLQNNKYLKSSPEVSVEPSLMPKSVFLKRI
jgi:hypothetical protein